MLELEQNSNKSYAQPSFAKVADSTLDILLNLDLEMHQEDEMSFKISQLQYDVHQQKVIVSFVAPDGTNISIFQMPFHEDGALTRQQLEEKARREARHLLEKLIAELPTV